MGVGGGAVLLGTNRLLGSRGRHFGTASSSTGTITVGFVSPQTGDLADFATSNSFAVGRIQQTPMYAKGFRVGGRTYQAKIITKDSQSDPNRASQVAKDLILNDNADLIITSSTPETDNPVALVCEEEGDPLCLHGGALAGLVRRPGR
jgi:branched-chain amino acid transport system substrate-binding protein